jgi:hypothetical protein
MVVRYHWGCGVGHTYAYAQGEAGVTSVPVAQVAQVEGHDDDVGGQEVGLSGEGGDVSDSERSLGEDDMVYQNDSDDNTSGEDDEVCSLHSITEHIHNFEPSQ